MNILPVKKLVAIFTAVSLAFLQAAPAGVAMLPPVNTGTGTSVSTTPVTDATGTTSPTSTNTPATTTQPPTTTATMIGGSPISPATNNVPQVTPSLTSNVVKTQYGDGTTETETVSNYRDGILTSRDYIRNNTAGVKVQSYAWTYYSDGRTAQTLESSQYTNNVLTTRYYYTWDSGSMLMQSISTTYHPDGVTKKTQSVSQFNNTVPTTNAYAVYDTDGMLTQNTLVINSPSGSTWESYRYTNGVATTGYYTVKNAAGAVTEETVEFYEYEFGNTLYDVGYAYDPWSYTDGSGGGSSMFVVTPTTTSSTKTPPKKTYVQGAEAAVKEIDRKIQALYDEKKNIEDKLLGYGNGYIVRPGESAALEERKKEIYRIIKELEGLKVKPLADIAKKKAEEKAKAEKSKKVKKKVSTYFDASGVKNQYAVTLYHPGSDFVSRVDVTLYVNRVATSSSATINDTAGVKTQYTQTTYYPDGKTVKTLADSRYTNGVLTARYDTVNNEAGVKIKYISSVYYSNGIASKVYDFRYTNGVLEVRYGNFFGQDGVKTQSYEWTYYPNGLNVKTQMNTLYTNGTPTSGTLTTIDAAGGSSVEYFAWPVAMAPNTPSILDDPIRIGGGDTPVTASPADKPQATPPPLYGGDPAKTAAEYIDLCKTDPGSYSCAYTSDASGLAGSLDMAFELDAASGKIKRIVTYKSDGTILTNTEYTLSWTYAFPNISDGNNGTYAKAIFQYDTYPSPSSKIIAGFFYRNSADKGYEKRQFWDSSKVCRVGDTYASGALGQGALVKNDLFYPSGNVQGFTKYGVDPAWGFPDVVKYVALFKDQKIGARAVQVSTEGYNAGGAKRVRVEWYEAGGQKMFEIYDNGYLSRRDENYPPLTPDATIGHLKVQDIYTPLDSQNPTGARYLQNHQTYLNKYRPGTTDTMREFFDTYALDGGNRYLQQHIIYNSVNGDWGTITNYYPSARIKSLTTYNYDTGTKTGVTVSYNDSPNYALSDAVVAYFKTAGYSAEVTAVYPTRATVVLTRTGVVPVNGLKKLTYTYQTTSSGAGDDALFQITSAEFNGVTLDSAASQVLFGGLKRMSIPPIIASVGPGYDDVAKGLLATGDITLVSNTNRQLLFRKGSDEWIAYRDTSSVVQIIDTKPVVTSRVPIGTSAIRIEKIPVPGVSQPVFKYYMVATDGLGKETSRSELAPASFQIMTVNGATWKGYINADGVALLAPGNPRMAFVGVNTISLTFSSVPGVPFTIWRITENGLQQVAVIMGSSNAVTATWTGPLGSYVVSWLCGVYN